MLCGFIYWQCAWASLDPAIQFQKAFFGGEAYVQSCVLPSSHVLKTIEDFGVRVIMLYIQVLYYVFYE